MRFSNIISGLASFASLAAATALPNEYSENALEARQAELLERTSSFSCPSGMSYCGWTRACSCPPGQSWNSKGNYCSGNAYQGAWPKPSASVYANVDLGWKASAGASVQLGAYCASSPYNIVAYDAKHSYCQASVKNVVFLAPLDIVAELKIKAGAKIDVNADISINLKTTIRGLAGLYIESSAHAVALFNTNSYGFGVRASGVVGGILGGVIGTAKGLLCSIGLGNCAASYDCVSYCTKGCKNYVDVHGSVGGYIGGLVGFAIGAKAVFTVGVAGVVSVVVNDLLCIIGKILTGLLSTFNCGC